MLINQGEEKRCINNNEFKGLPDHSPHDAHLALNKHFQRTGKSGSEENWGLFCHLTLLTSVFLENSSTFEKAVFYL